MKRPLIAAAIGTSLLIAGFITCTSTGPSPLDDPASALIDDEPTPPPFVEPPAPTPTPRTLPEYGRDRPDFPALPDEDTDQSRSVGTVTDGHLFGARRVPLPHPYLRFVPRQFERSLHYTGDPMLELLDDAARHVAEAHPGRQIHLGNLSRAGGGDIPYSVSHNNGRDADIAFFVVDDDGEPTTPPDLLSMNDDGLFDGTEADDETLDDLVLEFDTAANWRLVEGLIESDAADIQYVFVSNPLRRNLLAEARHQDAAPETLAIAREVLLQPGGNAQPHDDHFHVRIHCTPRDFAAGCRERGRPGPTFTPDRRLRAETLHRADELLDDEDPRWRRTALRRIALFDDHGLAPRIEALVDDPSPGVRIAASRPLRDRSSAVDILAARLQTEEHPRVFAELVATLAHHGDGATPVLVDALDRDGDIALGDAGRLPKVALVADALARHEAPEAVPALIDRLDGAPPAARPQIAHALRILTNHRFADEQSLRDDAEAARIADDWRDWWADYEDRDRQQWIADGFRRQGFDVDELGEEDVWELCRAISEDRFLSVNAQRVLEEISGQNPGSLSWDPYDASFHWRRWFERRKDEFDVPSMPEELSTAGGYTPPD